MIKAIVNRRSVRSYTKQPVPPEHVMEVIRAGFCAPSAHGAAPWHAVVVSAPEVLTRLSRVHRYAKVIGRAPVAVVVCVDRSGFDHFWIEDGSAFMENLLLQAAELGLGSCWVGIRGVEQDGVDAEDYVRETCGLPQWFGVVGITPLGYPAREPAPHEARIPEGRIHFEKYANRDSGGGRS